MSAIVPPPLELQVRGLGDARRENFPVALRLLRPHERDALLAIYGFARLVDDIGDEAAGDRPALLDWAESELESVYDGAPSHPVFQRLAPVARSLSLPQEPFQRLIEANRRDQDVVAYATFDELLDYCRLSANPVGELVLHVFDAATPQRVTLSDRICSGLQVAEHLQDVREDLARGRVYLPAEDLEGERCSAADLRIAPSPPALRRVVALETDRARGLLLEGAPVVRMLPWRAALAVAAFTAGGLAALDALARASFDVSRPHQPPSRVRLVRALPRVMRASRSQA